MPMKHWKLALGTHNRTLKHCPQIVAEQPPRRGQRHPAVAQSGAPHPPQPVLRVRLQLHRDSAGGRRVQPLGRAHPAVDGRRRHGHVLRVGGGQLADAAQLQVSLPIL
jgi:hypothetical protein